MPRTMPSGAERVQPMPLTRIIISLLFFFHFGQFRNYLGGGEIGKKRGTEGDPGTCGHRGCGAAPAAPFPAAARSQTRSSSPCPVFIF